jgi:hypothetical protein
MGAHGIYKSSQLRAVHAAAFLYADNELKQLDGLDQSASYGAFMNPATYSHWMNPAAFIHMMNPAQYRQGMNQNAYAQFMKPAMYMQWMPPASYAMPATANMQSGFNIFGPNAWGKFLRYACRSRSGLSSQSQVRWARQIRLTVTIQKQGPHQRPYSRNAFC